MAKGSDVRSHRAPKLYKRGETWWCYWRNERWSTGTTSEQEAGRIVREHYDPRHISSRERVIGDAIKLLYDALDRRGRSKSTCDQARQKLGHFARLWADKPLAEIDWATVSAYIDARLAEKVSQSGRTVARLTVSHELGYLRQAWKLARAQGWCPRAWDEIMPERFDRQYRPRTRWLQAAELRAVLASLPDEQAGLVAWIVATGSDIGDVARAEPGDIDWRRGLVRVRGTKTVFRDRAVPITRLTRPLLKLAERFGPPFEPWPSIGASLRKLAVRLGLEHFSPKDLRRTHGQWLRSAGVEPHLIGRVLGHADSAMADRVYAQGDEVEIARLVHHAIARSRPKPHSYKQAQPRTNVVRNTGTNGPRPRPAGRKASGK